MPGEEKKKLCIEDVYAVYRRRPGLSGQEMSIDSRNTHGNTPLHEACESDDLESAKILIDSGADVNAAGEGEASAFHFAIKHHGSLELVKLLLEKGASLEAKEGNNDRPIHLAARRVSGGFDCLRLLVDAGADVNAEGNMGRTALHIAAEDGSLDKVKLLLSRGGTLKNDCNGETPLDLSEAKLKCFQRIRDALIKHVELSTG